MINKPMTNNDFAGPKVNSVEFGDKCQPTTQKKFPICSISIDRPEQTV